MTKELGSTFEKFMEIMKKEEAVSGAWNFGSVTHDLSDDYSDVDVVFLVKGEAFEQINKKMKGYLEQVCDGVALCWPESFNSDAIINNGYLLKQKEQLMQFDVFLLNEDKLDDYMCRIHYTDLKPEDVLFDRDGQVQKLIDNAPKGEAWKSELETLNITYWFHMNMTIKYLKRKDYFKLHYLMRTLMDTHVSLLLSGFDQTTWGGMASKLQFLSEEKQQHVMQYRCTEDFTENISTLWRVMNWFEEDYNEICNMKGVKSDNRIAIMVEEFWIDCM